MPVAAMRVTRLASRPRRLVVGRSLGERCRLALARTPSLSQLALQLGNASVSSGHRVVQLGDRGLEASDEGAKIGDDWG